MSEKRKISVRKILQVLVTVLVTGSCVFALLSASRLQRNEKIQGIDIKIKNSQYGFIDKEEINSFLASRNHGNILKTSIGKLDEGTIEKTVASNPWVANAQVFVDNGKVVHINLSQRVPVARLFDQAGNSYYLDHTMKEMPLSSKYIHYTTVVTNVPVLKDDSMSNALKSQIVALVKYIDGSEFWRAQISQIIVSNDRTFEVVPVLGKQRILVGDTSRLDEKFDILFAFYKKVLDKIGWDKYETLDIRYAGQIVALPALQWKVPVDNAMSNMSWVKSIIGKDSGAYHIDSPSMQIQRVLPLPKPKNAFSNMPVKKAPAVSKTDVPHHVLEKKHDAAPKPASARAVQPNASPKKIEHKKPEIKEKSPPAKKEKQNKEQTQPKYLYH